jgi:5'-methylthioinosine phosphorylase
MHSRTIAIIAGTGLAASLTRDLEAKQVFSEVNVDFGDRKGSVLHYTLGKYRDLNVIVLPRHGPTVAIPDRSPAELVRLAGHEAHIWQLHRLGVKRVYAFNSVGALDRSVPLASDNGFLIPDEYGRGFSAVSHSFGALALEVHPSMAVPFDPEMRELLQAATERAGAYALMEGTYIHSAGDAFESAAEVEAYRVLYQHAKNKVVGMTSGAEVVLCKQMQMSFALICASCNWAQGLEPAQSVTHEHVLNGMRPATDTLQAIALKLVEIEAERR